MTDYTTATATGGCFPKVVNSWQQLLSSINLRRPIHPLDPIAPEHSEFFLIEQNVRIRVIHLSPEKLQKPLSNIYSELHLSSKRSSLSEEYWFTKWNKPLKIGNCNCSFRRSFRFSVASNQSQINKAIDENSRHSVSSFDAVPRRIVDVETFVERILQETIFEAFQEYYMLQNKEKGFVNAAYLKTEDEGEVVLRKKSFVTNCITKQPSRSLSGVSKTCYHKKNVQKKPCVILFHGIANSADVWWLIINSLVNKGFEVIAPDMLGHGYSSAPNKASYYTFHNLLIHAITIFDHYVGTDDKRKCILIGHSYGCSLITALYRHRASQISQLILISGGGPTPLAAPVKNSEISPFGCVHTLFRPLLFCGLKRSFLFSSRGKHFDICDPEPAIPSQILEYLSRGQNWPEGDAAFHRRILIPTLLVHGLQDKQVTLVQQCEMERTIPRAFLELIPNAGHMSMLETPEHLSHMILCFIDTWS